LLLIFAVLFGGYYLLIGNSGGLDYLGSLDEAELIRVVTTPIINIGQKLFPNFVLGRAVFAPDFAAFISNFAISIAILSGLFVVAVFVASLCYNRAVSSQLETPKSLKTKDRELRSDKNILVTLIKKEWTEIIKEPSIAFYCLMQVLFAPIMIFAMSITMPPELSAGSVATDSNLMLVIITVAQLFFVLAMGMTGATSITRENKNFYIMKVIPVAYETQIKAKVYIGVIITTVSLILSNVIALIAFKTDVFFTVVAAGFLIILGYAASMQSTALDLNKPRLNWQTVTEGLKNNSAQLVGMIYSLGGILIFGGLAGLTFWLYATSNLSILFYAMWAVFYLIALLLAYMFKKHLYKNLSEKIEAIAH
jgi:ABC-2 type transport system permease protein